MTDLILEYGNNPNAYPRVQNLNQAEIALFNTTNQKIFFNINSNNDYIIQNGFFHNNKRVPDVYRYDLVKTNGSWELVYPNSVNNKAQPGCYCYDITNIDPNKNNILIILESPHQHEYDYNNGFIPLTPAQNSTGNNFCKYFTSHVLNHSYFYPLLSMLNKNEYSICFVNPVPFQTSLHFIHEKRLFTNGVTGKLRDKIWEQLFNNHYLRTDFINRMQLYSSIKPVIILNSCTGKLINSSVKSGTLKDNVKSIINQNMNCTNKVNTYHPSFWHAHKGKPNFCSSW
ncbi:MAG: hypothetical protein NTY50_08300 [Methylobacter sp.]|nr:hypothetical protein [Methylobacter sp.]